MKKHIIQFLSDAGITYRWLDHVAVFTVKDASLLEEELVHIKNLLIQEEGNGKKFLVIMAGNKRLDIKNLKITLHAKKLRFANDEVLMKTFGVAPGSVSIFGMLHKGSLDTRVLVDKEILKNDQEIGFHPNDNTATIFIDASSLVLILQKLNCDYTILKLY